MRDAGALRPVLPSALCLGRVRLVARARGARVDLALAERLELAQLHGLELNARMARQVDRHAHDVDQRPRRRGEAMAAHQRDVATAELAREASSLSDVG